METTLFLVELIAVRSFLGKFFDGATAFFNFGLKIGNKPGPPFFDRGHLPLQIDRYGIVLPGGDPGTSLIFGFELGKIFTRLDGGKEGPLDPTV